ncbi:eukaryotic initiation factor 3, gamma subunit, putative [Entamoeba histolytica HM-1:IMSS-B]|uniref:tRNA (adenine(58)-N(1))-methyltransferase non-catalytic subunit TRM6 n=6 Tax=Entamoeba histolytica TaxID=5759 RepID=C4M352_ENTH1|nr:hypothetical protein, conserved [Entamoeba histolytica HM-1:IMSS]EMD47098.1 eukaryotic initiation factor 3 gamma subunit protein, putative [Entamoeba histolytica KU27]EMH76693.1 eukaryotic initiation factor 3, gamma subunit, putative [Entamoeba histolytica HM-1:IMSS-B]EMS11259.1 eukaryotic initiation factor 3, gamma subunit protein [Entamoeba histolytica HM-3:IMSS]ENY65300.1 eukaryotic initiation factor 3, gamma subunit protein, putative [Entamoeba histolytica HM-1:IMSS-A]GAT95733.1 hypothe|eukprot:XP_653075.1 hypothetical protein, conserved [Entamoeba histolytica HM-1:IMSS]
MSTTTSLRSTIQLGDYCILKRDEIMTIVEVKEGVKKRFAKKEVQVDSLIGKSFGQWVEVKDNIFVDGKSPDELVAEFCINDGTITKDNRNLQDSNSNQQLTDQQIVEMKQNGLSGEEIIKELLSHSDTYEGKTAFSQEKYIKKKIGKHVATFQILEASPINVCDYYNLKGNFKAGRVREDMLSYIMFHSDLRESVGIMENCNGLILGSVLRAVTPNVKVYTVKYSGEQYSLATVLAPHFSESPTDDCQKYSVQEKLLHYTSFKYNVDVLPQVNSLIIVTDVEPFETVKTLFPSLKKSGSLVVYCQYLDKLARLFDYLWKKKCIVYADVIEPFTRTIQVLPNRTHPNVLMDSNGGYLLYGIKVGEISSSEPQGLQEEKEIKEEIKEHKLMQED